MKQQQVNNQQMNVSYLTRFYLFLRDRDAKIIELFFLALNIYILALIFESWYDIFNHGVAIRTTFQLLIISANAAALLKQNKAIRIISSLSNAMIMSFVSFALIDANDGHAGTYILLALLAIFACWKITAR